MSYRVKKKVKTWRNNKTEIEHLIILREKINDLINDVLTELIADQKKRDKT